MRGFTNHESDTETITCLQKVFNDSILAVSSDESGNIDPSKNK